uniref:BRCT domain-containing protein n=1 Tax=Eptatretus burgeri TaxID=7764 RepID=A0A8C4QCU7_EPTBU
MLVIPQGKNCDEYTASRESSGGAIVEHKSARDGSVEMVGKAGNTSTGLRTEKPSNTARQLRRTGTVNVINKGMRELMGKSEKCKNGRDFQNRDVISSSNKGNGDATSLQDVREKPVHKAEEKKDEKSVKDEDQGSDHCRSELEDPQEQQLRVESKDNVADGSHGVTGKCEAIEQDERTDSQVHIATNDLQSSPKNYGRGRRRKLPNVAKKTPGRRKKTTPEDAGHLLTSESGNFDRIADDDINVESISIEPTPPEDEVSGSEPDVLDLSISSSGTSACKSTTTQKRSGRQQQTSTNFEESMSGHVEQHGGKTRKSQRLGFDPEIPPDNVPTVKLKQLGPEDNEPHKGQIVPRVGEHHDDENSQHKPKNTQKSKVTKTKAGSLAVGDKMEGPDRRTLRKRTASEATITSTEQGPTTIHTMAGDFENVKVQRKNVDVENELNNSSCDTDLPDTLVSSSGSISESSETVCGERKEAKSNARGKKSPRDPQIANNCRRSRRFVSDELVALSSPDKSKVLVKTSQHVTRSRLDSLTFKVLFTGVLDDMGQEAVRKLGGSVTENPLEASHLVTDRVRRTVKFLCAVARGLPIVQPEWLKRSLRKKTILPEEDFLVQDTEAERRFDFCLQDSLAKARKEPCLQGMQVHVTCSVKPEPEYMSTIIKCAGGIFLPKMPHTLKDNVVIVSCEEDASRWLPARQTGFLIASAELILTGVLRQSAQAASFLLSDDPQSQESPNSTVNSSLSDKQRSGAASKRCTNKRR